MMVGFKKRSLLIQLLSVYVLFVLIVLTGELAVNSIAAQHLRQDVQSSDQALARSIALQTSLQIQGAEEALNNLSQLLLPNESQPMLIHTFQAFQIARPDVDHVYWMDPFGGIQVVWPGASVVDYTGGIGAEFAPPAVVPAARASNATVVEVGIAVETTSMPSVILARAVRSPTTAIIGIVAISLSLVQLSQPLQAIVQEQQQHRTLAISIVDDQGELVATSESEPSLLQSALLVNVLSELPGAAQALRDNHTSSNMATDEDGQEALYSAVPLRAPAWAVVVKRPTSEAFKVSAELQTWLLLVALLFALGGMLFWLLLVNRVIRPLHILALEHQALPDAQPVLSAASATIAQRQDEVGALARSLERLEHDGLTKLGELHTLLDTSTAVVGSLDPYAVVGTIIAEVRRLVDVQAAAVLVPDEQGILRVLGSEGHSEHYDRALSLDPENVSSSAVLALREARPVQKLMAATAPIPSLSFEEGFRAVLAIPIISRHAGGVVLLVHRTEPIPFTQTEINLLLTFANYATLAWEHAVLYERSDERLRQIAHENEQLYRQAMKTNEFKTTLLEAVSHEIRTPLTAIKGYASTLLQDDVVWPQDDQRHFLQTISGEADRLGQLVSNLLDLSRQEAGILHLRRAPVTVEHLIGQVIERQPHEGHPIIVQIPANLPMVEVDGARIAVVLRNLLANAIIYGDGEVRICATPRTDDVVISVANDGQGIPVGELPHVFERFYRTHEGQQRHSGGTGLGLSICKAFVEAHGGTIWAEQRDGGIAIAFTLPTVVPAVTSRQFVERVTL